MEQLAKILTEAQRSSTAGDASRYLSTILLEYGYIREKKHEDRSSNVVTSWVRYQEKNGIIQKESEIRIELPEACYGDWKGKEKFDIRLAKYKTSALFSSR